MRWLVAAALSALALTGCRGSQEGEETRSRQQQAAREQPAEGSATEGEESLWDGNGEGNGDDETVMGTGAVTEQQRQREQEILREPGDEPGGVWEYGSQIEAEKPGQVGIVDGVVASVEGQNLTVQRADGSTVRVEVDEDALFTLRGQPVGVDRLSEVEEGTPVRAEFSRQGDRNLAGRIEIPAVGAGAIQEMRPAPQDQGMFDLAREQPDHGGSTEGAAQPAPDAGQE